MLYNSNSYRSIPKLSDRHVESYICYLSIYCKEYQRNLPGTAQSPSKEDDDIKTLNAKKSHSLFVSIEYY